LIIKILSAKDLRRNPIANFNSILSARLICILDFVFPETSPVGWAAMARRLLATTDLD